MRHDAVAPPSAPLPAAAALRVLVVDDEADIRDLVAGYLASQGMLVFEASSEAGLWQQVRAHAPDVVLLDVNLGCEDGFSIARRLRADWSGGLLMVTGRGDMTDRVVGLEIGADDYVTKPFELRELLARIRSVSRRSRAANGAVADAVVTAAAHPPAGADSMTFDGFILDQSRRELRAAHGGLIALTTGEYELLRVLVEHAGQVLSRDQLLQKTHHRDAGPFDRTIDVQIGRLRRKLGDSGKEPRLIKAVRGAGYLLAVTPGPR